MEGFGADPDWGRNCEFDAVAREWTTSWSRFTYKLLAVEEGVATWEYKGALSGFLQQELLPTVLKEASASKEVYKTFEKVEGTYGCFEKVRLEDRPWLKVRGDLKSGLPQPVHPHLSGTPLPEGSPLAAYMAVRETWETEVERVLRSSPSDWMIKLAALESEYLRYEEVRRIAHCLWTEVDRYGGPVPWTRWRPHLAAFRDSLKK